ncbi:hypothetical protein [Kineothrix sedimenti]|uniref:Uncharacterized protein n=1 Tax=Kineothrix sedimenti TaxID=3123317 RepID=A0ABZ3ESG0_9FIRM
MKRKDEALRLFNLIPDGHTEPLQRPSNTYTDRILRTMIEDANKKGDCIINVGHGIYRPVPGDPVDEAELKRYLASELSRARKVLHKRMCMNNAFTERKDNEILTNHTRKIG